MVQRASEGGQYADQRPFNRSLRWTSINRPHRSLVSKTCRKIQQAPYFPTNENGKRCNGLVFPRRRKNKGKLSIKSFFRNTFWPVLGHAASETWAHADRACNFLKKLFCTQTVQRTVGVQDFRKLANCHQYMCNACVRVRKNPRAVIARGRPNTGFEYFYQSPKIFYLSSRK